MKIGLGLDISHASMGGAGMPVFPPAQNARTLNLPFDGSIGAGTFTRSTNAWNPETGAVAAHNLLTYSADLTNANWGKTGAPSTTATKIVEDTSTGVHSVGQGQTLVAGLTYIYTVWLSAAERTWAAFQVTGTGGNAGFYVNLVTGAKGNELGTPTATSITDDNGVWKCSVTFTSTGAGAASPTIYNATANGTVSFTGVAGSGINVHKQQLNAYSLTTYVPTTTAAVYMPRFVSGKSGQAILVEEASENKCLRSNAFTTSPWGVYNANTTVTAAPAVADPFGGTGAWQVDMAAASTGFRQAITVVAATTYTGSLWIKADAAGTIRFTDGTANPVFDITANVTTSWQRITGTGAKGSGTSCEFAIYRNSAGQLAKVYIYGAQLEALPYATSYIPTTTASLQRGAERDSNTSASVIAAAPASVTGWVKFEGVVASKTQTIWSSYTDASNWISVEYNGTAFIATKRVAGTTTVVTHATTAVVNTWYHFCLIIKSNNQLDLYISATQAGTNATTVTGVPVFGATHEVGSINNTLQLNGAADAYNFYNKELSASEILQSMRAGR